MLQDYIPPTGKDFNELDAAQKLDYQLSEHLRLRGLFEAELDNECKTKLQLAKEVAGAMALEREANRSWMKRFDHPLFSSLGFGLSHFAPPRRLRALEEGERRYFTAVQRPEDGTVVQRSCLLTPAGTRSYELPRVVANGSAKWPSLHVSCDEGSIGLSALIASTPKACG